MNSATMFTAAEIAKQAGLEVAQTGSIDATLDPSNLLTGRTADSVASSRARNIDVERACESFLSPRLFPGRKTLYVHEVAVALSISPKHVVELILERQLRGTVAEASKKVTSRSHWRVTVADYDAFVLRRCSARRRRPRRTERQ